MISNFDNFTQINEEKENIFIVFTESNFDSRNEESTLMACYIKSLLQANKIKQFYDAGRFYAKIMCPITVKKGEEIIDKIYDIIKNEKSFISYYNVSMKYCTSQYSRDPFLTPMVMTKYLSIIELNGNAVWNLQISKI